MLDLFENETLGRPVIECPYNLPGCGTYAVPINYLWYGYTPNDTPVGDGGGNSPGATATQTAAVQTASQTPPLGQPAQQPIIDGVDNKTLLIGAAIVAAILLTR